MAQGPSNNITDIKKLNGTSISVNAGNKDAGTQRVVIATDQTVLPISDNNGSITVDGTFWQATQPVSLASLPALSAGNNNIGDVDIASLPGTVASDITAIKTATELLDNAIGTDGSAIATGMLRVGGTDGTNNQTISVTTAGAVNIADGGNSITVDGTVGISGTVPVSGTFWQSTQPVSIASAVPITDNLGSLTVDAPVGTPVFVRLSSGSAAVDTIPVSLASVPTHAVTQSGTWNVGLSAGTNAIGKLAANDGVDIGDVTINNASIAVTGTFWQATQPVSLASVPSHNVTNAGTFAVQAAQSGTWNIGTVTAVTAITNALPAGTNAIGKLAANSGVIIGTVELTSATTNTNSNSTTTAYASSLVVKASAGVLYMLSGYNSKTSGQFIQLHDTASVPADSAVPKVIFYVPPQSNFSYDFSAYGRSFTAGIVICNSSTGPTKTIGSADCWFDVQYK